MKIISFKHGLYYLFYGRLLNVRIITGGTMPKYSQISSQKKTANQRLCLLFICMHDACLFVVSTTSEMYRAHENGMRQTCSSKRQQQQQLLCQCDANKADEFSWMRTYKRTMRHEKQHKHNKIHESPPINWKNIQKPSICALKRSM